MALGNNLEYLSISNADLSEDTLKNLNKLFALRLYECGCLESNMFRHLSYLETLEIMDTYFNNDWLFHLKSLKKLYIVMIGKVMENLDFLMIESLSKLEYLKLVGSDIYGAKEKTFSMLTSLRRLEISVDTTKSDVFVGLDNLETLIIGQVIEFKKDDFNGLNNLKTLEIKYIKSIDPEVFIHTPILSDLRIIRTNCKLDENLLTHLKRLKKIQLSKSDLNCVDSNLLDALRRSNIEIIFN